MAGDISRKNLQIQCIISFILVWVNIISSQDTFEVTTTYELKLSTEPADATCGQSANESVWDQGDYVLCRTRCKRQYPLNHKITELTPPGKEVHLGKNCPALDILENNVDSDTLIHLCYSDVGLKDRYDSYTIHTVVKPDKDHTYGTLLALPKQEVEVKVIDGVFLQFDFNGYGGHTNENWRLSTDKYTAVTLQVHKDKYSTPVLSVFLNGEFVPPALYAENPSRRRRQAGGTGVPGQEEASGGGSDETEGFFPNIRLGLTSSNLASDSGKCSQLEFGACRDIGYSESVHMPNLLNHTTQRQAYEFLRDNMLLEALDICPLSKNISLLYGCSFYTPPCLDFGMALYPCRSLCTVFNDACERYFPEGALEPCENFPESNCVGVDFKPDYALFRGKIKESVFYHEVLTDREIKAMFGDFPRVEPMSECLCPGDYPAVDMSDTTRCKDHFDRDFGVSRLPGIFLMDFAVDNKTSTRWIASPSKSHVTFTVAWDAIVEVVTMNITLEGMYSEYLTIQLENDFEKLFTVYLSFNCDNLFDREDIQPSGSYTCALLEEISYYEFKTESPSYYVQFQNLSKEFEENSPGIIREADRATIGFGNNEAYHSIKKMSIKAREVDCSCYTGGTVEGSKCGADRQCQCRPLPREKDIEDKAGLRCEPFVNSMIPDFGPKAGRTDMFIFGGYFGQTNNSAMVLIGDIPCDLKFNNDTLIHCLTRPLQSTLDAFPVTIRIGNKEVITGKMFTYMEDPVIKKVEPLESFLKGGVELTVTGENLDSVFAPIMQVDLVFKTRIFKQPDTICSVKSNSTMMCPTPEISNLPPELSGIQKRDLSNHIARSLTSLDKIESSHTRQKRQSGVIIDGTLNSKDVEFYLGFKLDGVEKYRNLTETLPEFSVLTVFESPKIFDFTEEERVKAFESSSPRVHILGEKMNYGCQLDDYKVYIGSGLCEAEDLLFNVLTCMPPSEEPELLDGEFTQGSARRVLVEVGNLRYSPGYVNYNTGLSGGAKAGIAVGVLLIILIIVAILGYIIYKKRQEKNNAKKSFEIGLDHSGLARFNTYDGNAQLHPNTNLLEMLDEEMKAKVSGSLIPKENLTLGSEIGKGNFGKVFKGWIKSENENPSTLVAVKSVREDGSTLRDIQEFLAEATIMKDFDHPNVINLIGIVIDGPKPMVVLPIMQNGDLRNFISKPQNQFSVKDLLGFGHQVAMGMEYLSKERFIHRDLAARNCMINIDMEVKIADFGLARDVYMKDYYRVEDRRRPLPVKWLAIECLESQRFSAKSDVWAFAVTLWELLTRGRKPYADVDNIDMKKYLLMGRRLEKPPFAPPEIYELMLRCWNPNPEIRPTFTDIRQILGQTLEDDYMPPETEVDGSGYADRETLGGSEYERPRPSIVSLHTYETGLSGAAAPNYANTSGDYSNAAGYYQMPEKGSGEDAHLYVRPNGKQPQNVGYLDMTILVPHDGPTQQDGYLDITA